MTIKEMRKWIEDRGMILCKHHSKKELTSIIHYLSIMRDEKNPLE